MDGDLQYMYILVVDNKPHGVSRFASFTFAPNVWSLVIPWVFFLHFALQYTQIHFSVEKGKEKRTLLSFRSFV